MAWWDQIGSLSRDAADWLNRVSGAGAGALNQGGERILPSSTPPGAPGYVAPPPPPTPSTPSTPAPTPTETAAALAAEVAAKQAAAAAADAGLSTLDRFNKQRRDTENAIIAAEAAFNKDPNSAEGDTAGKALPGLRALLTNIQSQVAAEENRLRDEKTAKEKEEKEKKDKPQNGDTRVSRDTYKLPNGQTVEGVFTEVYNNGAWSYVNGSAKPASGFAGQPQGVAQITTQVLNDGRGAYWTYDQATGKVTPINGPAAAVKTINGPDGGVYIQKPDGTLGERLFEGLPQTYNTPDGFVVGVDRRTGQQVFRVDTKTAEGRELATRLERATVEAAERSAEPKFASAVAQYQQEVTRRQGLARTELARLQERQQSGQISPDQAEAQFDRWMQTNVEGPLAGFRAAAEEERRKQEQENLTRQTTENTRVEAANALRGRAGYEAGETAKAQALQVGLKTRAPEYNTQLGQFAQSLAQGKTNFQFDPAALDPAKFKAVQPDYDAIANQAMQRLFGLYPEAKAQNVNVALPSLPTGQDLLGLMDGVKYSGPLSGTPTGETPLPGQEAIDQGNGKARTVYGNGRYVDWDINAPAPQLAQAGAAAPSLPGLGGPDVAGPPPPFTPPSVVQSTAPGALPGETDEQRRARWAAIMSR